MHPPAHTPVQYVVVEPESDDLVEVVRLWRPNAATLGFFPQGAFEEYAARGGIVVARDDNSILGYVAFRQVAQWIVVVHLCVAQEARRQGIARSLIGWLRRQYHSSLGMKLRCRRDYAAHEAWAHLGFRAAGARPAKTPGEHLIDWHLDFRPETSLFSWSARQQSSRIAVGIDQNVFLDLYGNGALVRLDPESEVLQADWLSSEINLYVTDEVFNEITRMNVPEHERQRLRGHASSLRQPHCDAGEFEEHCRQLRALLPPAAFEDEGADVRHIARAISGRLGYFVTRDDALLSAASEIDSRYELRVLRPAELALEIDELVRAEEYAPRRLGGTLHKATRAGASDFALLGQFLASASGEKRADFERFLRENLEDPRRTRIEICCRPDRTPAALLAVEDRSTETQIHFVRAIRDRTTPTLLRYQLERIIREAAKRDVCCVRISDRFLSDEAKAAAAEAGFLQNGKNWIKLQLKGFYTPMDLAASAQASLADIAPEMSPPLGISNASLIDLEHLLRPAKIRDTDLPSFIVPIRPYWAANLFEERMARNLLHGARAELAFSPEFVYYRAARPEVLRAPGRVLWYVSKGNGTDKGFDGRMSLCAYSRIAEVAIDKPKAIFRRFRRLGVYEWKNVFETAKRDVERQIMAIRCVDTELLARPIVHRDLQHTLQEHSGSTNPLVGPLEISASLFERLYGQGSGLNYEQHRSDVLVDPAALR